MSLLPDDRATNLAVWAGLWSAVVVWQVLTVASRRLPTVGDFVGLLRRWWLSRWVLLSWWAWLGWHLFVRTTG